MAGLPDQLRITQVHVPDLAAFGLIADALDPFAASHFVPS